MKVKEDYGLQVYSADGANGFAKGLNVGYNVMKGVKDDATDAGLSNWNNGVSVNQ